MPLFLGFFLLLLVTCDSTPKNQEIADENAKDTLPTAEVKDSVMLPPDDRPALVLYGAYATSTAPQNALRKAFDRDPQTAWLTTPGAGPDEGVMLYFQQSTFIKNVQLEAVSGGSIAAIEEITVYGNGSLLATGAPGDIIPLEANFENLYFRITATGNCTTKQQIYSRSIYDTLTQITFSPNYQVGFSTIRITGENGEYRVEPPERIPGSVTASSTLDPASPAYDVSQLFDSRREFAWVEGAKGNGVGETLAFQFEEEVEIGGLVFWNGYQRSNSHYKANARLKTFLFGESGIEAIAYDLTDTYGPQIPTLRNTLRGKNFGLKVNAAYHGRSYQDLAISELLFFTGEKFFTLNTGRKAFFREQFKTQAKGTILENLLDRRVANLFQAGNDGQEFLSAIFRSDGTFVMYTREEDIMETVSQTIADGNWEVLEANAEEAKLKVFGKYVDLSALELYYQGKAETELSRIFKDEITIRGNSIKGKRFLDEVIFR